MVLDDCVQRLNNQKVYSCYANDEIRMVVMLLLLHVRKCHPVAI